MTLVPEIAPLRHETSGRPRTAAPSILLSAGLGGLAAFWRPQATAFGAHRHVVSYDHRGTGANACDLPDDHSIGAMADDVVGVLDRAGVERCHFVGHALGGLVGIELALRFPERLASLVLVNAWDKALEPTLRCFAARRALLEHGGPEAYVRAQAIFLYPAAWLARNASRVEAEEAHGIASFQGTGNLLRRIAALTAYDVSTRLGEVSVPTLVVAARDDVLVPHTCSETLAAGIPGARLASMSDGGHSCSVTRPGEFDAIVAAFLDEVDHA